MTCKCSRNPMQALEALPAWWHGAASTRREFALQAIKAEHATDDPALQALHRKDHADHMRAASEHERKAANPPRPASALLINLRAGGAL